jgi:hypothetical protein
VFYLGKTGEAVISSFGDPSPESVVHIAFAGAGGIGLPDPILAGVRAEMLVFLGGVSPLRMFGCAPEDWKLVEVSEEAWVFEFDPDEEQRKKMAELSGFGKARVRLNRAYDDAPEQLEIFWRGDSYERWTTEAYRRVNDSWMPSRVLHEWSGADGTGRYVYELVAATPSAPIRIDIPEGTPVHDWRLLGRALWRGEWDDDRTIETQWSPELLRDLWRQIPARVGLTRQGTPSLRFPLPAESRYALPRRLRTRGYPLRGDAMAASTVAKTRKRPRRAQHCPPSRRATLPLHARPVRATRTAGAV